MQKSIWLNGQEQKKYETLRESTSTDVCIVGGGIAGIYTAYLLSKQGLKVTLLEAQESLATQTTSYSTGKLSIQHSDLYHQLLNSLSLEDIKTYIKANKIAIENALKDADPTTFNKADSYIYATTKEGEQQLLKELEVYKKLQLQHHLTNETELPFDIRHAICIPSETQVHPYQFSLHFADLAKKAGATIYTNSRVIHIDKSKKTVYVKDGNKVTYKKLILCTHYPIDSLKGLYIAKLKIKRSYLTASPIKHLLTGQYISLDSQSRTIRTATIDNEPYLLYGGGNHLAGAVEHTHEIYKQLVKEATSLFQVPTPPFQWSAQDIYTPDDLPYVGPFVSNDDSLYLATGFRKWGLSNSLLAGEILTSYLTGDSHIAKQLYSPQRSNFGKALLEILTNTGYIATSFIGGHLTRMNTPTCTHLGCKTRWNDGDKTWDCPCHGSRYTKDGSVFEGPAVENLKRKKS